MNVIFSDQEPRFDAPSIFLAGPTPRSSDAVSWRVAALELARQNDFAGTLFVPENHDWQSAFDYMHQVEWEFTCLEAATVIVFWVPRDLVTLPGFTTNVEFGRYVSSGRCVYGRPDAAPKNRYLDWLYAKCTGKTPCTTLESTISAAIAQAHTVS